jgi:hypothetical protein
MGGHDTEKGDGGVENGRWGNDVLGWVGKKLFTGHSIAFYRSSGLLNLLD